MSGVIAWLIDYLYGGATASAVSSSNHTIDISSSQVHTVTVLHKENV